MCFFQPSEGYRDIPLASSLHRKTRALRVFRRRIVGLSLGSSCLTAYKHAFSGKEDNGFSSINDCLSHIFIRRRKMTRKS